MNEDQTSLSAEKSDIRILTKSFDPIKLLKTYSAEEYEEIISEWINGYLKKKYVRVERLGGKGDKGRDVVCTLKDNSWENYQCKHYEKKLTPSIIWIEIGKLLYYVYKKEYSTPKKYYFMSPCGVGNKLRDLLQEPIELKRDLKKQWHKSCQKNIIKSKEINLDDDFQKFINSFDFSIFDYIHPDDFIASFKQTSYYTKRFGQLHKPRPINEDFPEKIQSEELVYIKKILDAYAEYLKEGINVKKLESHPDLKKHFERQRRNFYCAEYLRAHSREVYDPELHYFENLKNEIYDSIIDEIEDDANNGFERLKKVLKRAEQISISSNPLKFYLEVKDKKGICHHLANEREDVKWKK